MTLSGMLQDLYRRTGYASSPATEITTRFTAQLNQAHRAILTKPWAKRLRDDTIPLESVASQAVYALPPAVAKIEHIQDRANNRPIYERDLGWLRTRDAGLTNTGTPAVYVPRGIQPVTIQPSAAGTLTAVSTSASDVAVVVHIEGVRGNNLIAIVSATLTGMTPVALGSDQWSEITKFYLSGTAAVGVVTVTHSITGALGYIAVGSQYARRQTIQLWPTPSSVLTYHVDYVRTIVDLVNPTDEPFMPEDFHELLILGALIREFTKKDDSRRRDAQADFDAGLRDLRSWILTNPDTVASLRSTHHGWSSLGPSYPIDSWGGY